jgi:twitching motility protein PilU
MMQSLGHFLSIMVDRGASDLFVSSHLPVSAKINGELRPLHDHDLTEAESLIMVESAMSPKQIDEFHSTKECNFVIVNEYGCFCVLVFW